MRAIVLGTLDQQATAVRTGLATNICLPPVQYFEQFGVATWTTISRFAPKWKGCSQQEGMGSVQ